MKIKKYKATRVDNGKQAVGYIIPIRKHLGKGTYSFNDYDYLILVNETSSINGDYGNFLVHKDTIEEFGYFTCSQKCYDKL